MNGIVADWVRRFDRDEVLALCKAGEVPCGPIYTIDEIFADPHYRARGSMIEIEDERLGPLCLPAALPRLSRTPARFDHAGPALGADTAAVFAALAEIDEARLELLRRSSVI